MKRIIIAATLVAFAAPALADTYVRGHYRSNGTYVQPHYRSNPNSTTRDNYSTQGNTNPYTGQRGTTSPYGGSNLNGYSNSLNVNPGYRSTYGYR